jgi:hypothetical protein
MNVIPNYSKKEKKIKKGCQFFGSPVFIPIDPNDGINTSYCGEREYVKVVTTAAVPVPSVYFNVTLIVPSH